MEEENNTHCPSCCPNVIKNTENDPNYLQFFNTHGRMVVEVLNNYFIDHPDKSILSADTDEIKKALRVVETIFDVIADRWETYKEKLGRRD